MTKKKKMDEQHAQAAAEAARETGEPLEAIAEETQADEAAQGELLAQLEQASSEREEYLNLAQRVQADFENFKRRNQSVRSEAFDDGKREVIAALLPVLDNLERALAAEGEESPLKAGVDLVHRQLWDVLFKFGVTEIECLGKPFDPEEANAVMQAPEEGVEPGMVSDVMQKGYRMGDRVIRYAMVKVACE